MELDFYDNTPQGRAAIEQFVRNYNVKVVVFMSAFSHTVCLDLLRRLGVRTLNTENNGFDPRRRDGALKKAAKYVVRRVLRLQQHDLHWRIPAPRRISCCVIRCCRATRSC